MTDKFKNDEVLLDSVATDGFSVTPSDVTEFTQPTRAVYVGGAGAIVVEMLSYDDANTQLTFTSVPAGLILPVRVKKILATGTTATNIIALT